VGGKGWKMSLNSVTKYGLGHPKNGRKAKVVKDTGGFAILNKQVIREKEILKVVALPAYSRSKFIIWRFLRL